MIAHRTRIKICGIRDPAMARAAAQAGADAIGLVFHAASPRAVDPAEARAIVDAVPPFVTPVGLFVNRDEQAVRDVLARVPLGMLQFHGDEPPAYCDQFGLPWIRALRVGPGVDLIECEGRFSRAAALLLDADVAGQFGGTGVAFDWSLVPAALARRVVLSGGLDAASVGRAICAVRPWAVDVSSGVETSRGVKDAARIEEFVRSVRDADARAGG
ncbi:MAG: phosphoribosylanthranilate isomerase [Betaproteobacteria bacterium]|nr:phosphoribosylanthranilate isomerase [Betaproteobacteria bacterium]